MIFINNKYTATYHKIIDRASTRKLAGYAEVHHIIPKSLGGDNESTNLVRLTAREHFICHRLLTKMVTGRFAKSMIHAAWCMVMLTDRQHQYKINNRTYQTLKIQYSQMMKTRVPWNKGQKGIVKQTAASNKKRADTLKGRPSPNKGNFGELNPFFNKSHTPETKQKIKDSIKASGRVPWNKGKTGVQVPWNKGVHL